MRDIGITRAVTGGQFFVIRAGGRSARRWCTGGGHLVLNGAFTIGDRRLRLIHAVVRRAANLTNAPVAFATSMVSFERVFG